MAREIEHYSRKGGHLWRGRAARLKTMFESQFPDVPYHRPILDEKFVAKRSMMRDPNSGKRSRR